MNVTSTVEADSSVLFRKLGGTVHNGFPAIHSTPQRTPAGTPSLTAPGVVVLARPEVYLAGLRPFLEGFDPDLGFETYPDDPTLLDPGAQLVKVAGQTCYSEHAETEIRALAVRTLLCLKRTEPLLFAGLRIVNLSDGTFGITTERPKP